MILVTGATGTVGRELVRQLAAAEQKVRALVRPGRGADMRRRNVTLVEGDLDDVESLREALRGVDRVYLLAPSGPEMVQREANLIDAAAQSRVQHIVLHSVMGVGEIHDVRFIREHAESEQKLRESGIAWTFLRPTFFMSNLFEYASSIRREGRLFAPGGQGRAVFVDPADIAAAAVALLTSTKHAGEAHEITGPEALRYAEVAARIGATIGRTVEYVDVPPAAAREAMLRAGMSEWAADGMLELYRATREGRTSEVSDDFRRLVGRAPRPLDAYLGDHADAFREREPERPSPAA
jgi:uncharacterized protein YbjT (DUF2867 family)